MNYDKILIISFLIILILFAFSIGASLVYADDIYESVVTNADSEQWLWDEISKWSPNDVVTASILGYFKRESGYKSDSVAGFITRNIGRETDICEEFTEKIDGMDYSEETIKYFSFWAWNYGGYGLGQWSHEKETPRFLKFVKDRDGSIADAALQCEFVVMDIQELLPDLWDECVNDPDIYTIPLKIAYLYDGASNMGAGVIQTYALELYERYSK